MPAPQASKLGAVKGTAVTTPDSKDDPAFAALLSTIDASQAAARETLTKSPPKDWTPPTVPAPFPLDPAAAAGKVVAMQVNQLDADPYEGAKQP